VQAGILIRSVAQLLAAKQVEPPVVAVAEDGSVAVPLVGGHHGANALARTVAVLTGGIAAITTAGDLKLGLSLDEPPPGWRIAEAGGADWLHAGAIGWAEQVGLNICGHRQ
jgi:cobalt-precorrin 5A hydrolase/precorrin-3B C17-methyltransferase